MSVNFEVSCFNCYTFISYFIYHKLCVQHHYTIVFLTSLCSIEIIFPFSSQQTKLNQITPTSTQLLILTQTCQYPEFYSFPPFFTIQPVLATREKQLGLWRALILKYYTVHKMKTLVVHECPLWKNVSIERELDSHAISAVMKDFVER